MQLKISAMNYINSFVTKIGINFLRYQLLSHICRHFFYNNLTTYHKELQVFLGLRDIYYAICVIHQDILDQLREYILLNSSH